MEFEGQYLDFEEYEELGGSLDETPFNILEFEARKIIDKRTFDRLKKTEVLPQEVKMCVFALINVLQTYDINSTSSRNKNIVSENTDGYSVSYASGSQVQEIVRAKKMELDDIIMNYLSNVIVNNQSILYLGVK